VQVRWKDGDSWVRAEGQLRVDGNIRGDIVFTPGAVKFDSVDQGNMTEQKVSVTYRGRSNWKIVDVRGASDALEVELTERQRYSGQVSYDLLVRLKNSAPAGYFNDQLVLVTNDDDNPRIPIYVGGQIIAQISVSPESLFFGDVPQGQQVSKKIIVRGKKPFKIVSVDSDDKELFQFKSDDQSSQRHIVEITFNAKKSAGSVKLPVRISTDLGDKVQVGLTAFATILPSAPSTTVKESGDANAIEVAKPAGNDSAAGGAGAAGTTPGNVAKQ